MEKRDNVFRAALQGKKIPMLTLDNKWYKLFDHTGKTASIQRNEEQLNALLKKQGKLSNDIKSIRKLKKKLMQEIVDLMEEEHKGADKKAEENKRLIEECNEKIEAYEDELLELPKEIDKVNYALMYETMQLCYVTLHENASFIEEISKWITTVRIELKKKIVRKQEKEIENQILYTYMHNIFGADVIELFDMQYMPEPKLPQKKHHPVHPASPPQGQMKKTNSGLTKKKTT